ncbi:metallophosphoesterase [candidate division KSB1 bacterium]|nr:metallophosphoesterase [candidate division KSB1 bacterium]
MVIAHLSDLHICIKNKSHNLNCTRYLIESALKHEASHFIITGDVSHLSNPDDFLALRHLLEQYELLDSQKVSMVIGNHDIYGGVYLAEDILTFPGKCKTIDYYKKIQEFHSYFLEIFENTILPLPDRLYPYAKKVDDVLLIGINSTMEYSRLNNPFASRGKVGQKQIKGLTEIFARSEFSNLKKIVMSHHHFNKKPLESITLYKTFLHTIESYAGKLEKRKRLCRLLRKNKVDLVVHGHLHESATYERSGLKFINGAGAIEKNRPGELKLNLILVSPETIKTKIKTIQYTKEKLNRLTNITEELAI